MDTILIVGIETVAGANIAATLAGRYRIVGLSDHPSLTIAGCETVVCTHHDRESVRNWVAAERPAVIVYCGPSAVSSWDRDAATVADSNALHAARNWALAASEFASRIVVISSDAVFTGPWMFHAEDCECVCPSNSAQLIRSIEQQTAELCADTLIVRTNTFGWSPDAAGSGWIENALAAVETRCEEPFDWVTHGTPILASDLAEILHVAFESRLQGTYHIAGAERVNPAQFARKLADQFELDGPRASQSASLSEVPSGFGTGETSLQTQAIRRVLGVSLPLLTDGLSRLHEQRHNGYRDRLNQPATLLHDKVA